MDKLLIVMVCLCLVYGKDQQARIVLRMESTLLNQMGTSKDISLSTGTFKTVNRVFCQGLPGATFVVRTDPNSGHLALVDDILKFDDTTKGVKSCMPENDAVQCSSNHVCIPGSNCTVSLAIDCAPMQGPTKWERIPQVEVTFTDHHGKLVLQSCYVMCLASDLTDELWEQGFEEFSYREIDFIIDCFFLVGFFMVLGVVVWKIKNLNRFKPLPSNLNHEIIYIS
ncbi:unnamed protein product [Lymnaea stagnalis]|uniref:Uncharacterized protein n=1 Tax=Lymnaea stagnalis TaxID=6523 RepID=A0AAV2H8H1_LYMST